MTEKTLAARRAVQGVLAAAFSLAACVAMAADRTKGQVGDVAEAAGSYYGHVLLIKRIFDTCVKADPRFSTLEIAFMKRHQEVNAKAASIKKYLGDTTGQPDYLDEVLRKAERRLDANPSLNDLANSSPEELRAFCDRVPRRIVEGALDFRSFEPSNYRLIMEFEDELAVFRSLHRGITMAEGRARLGLPTRETGSGIAIDVYRLSDDSEVWLGYGSGGLIYAKHGKVDLLVDDGR